MIFWTCLYRLTESTWAVWLDAAPWLLVGLLLAGLVKAWVPTTVFSRWFGGRGFVAVVKAAILGTPMPLCSCSVLPAAMTIHRAGASKGATVSFLIATPENGADSISLSYALLGPFMTVVRPVAAITLAIVSGLLAEYAVPEPPEPPEPPEAPEAKKTVGLTLSSAPVHACCAASSNVQTHSIWLMMVWRKLRDGLKYAVIDLLDDIIGWLVVGVVVAGAVAAFVPPDVMARWGSGLPAMLAVLVISIPMYICASASTPMAAAMLLAGISPGTVLVFLLAGPATNVTTLGVVWKELGARVLVAYIAGVGLGTVALGLLTDAIVRHNHLNIAAQAGMVCQFMPGWLAMTAGILMFGMAIRSLGFKAWHRLAFSAQARLNH